ncbi:ABC transporter substrate-binding protein [Roseospira goensis]|uniref:Peptide/nickel transport system substrate-binding protein n=1 Tax=Roseospira goensis TaxID=391922 RepID=A0A7W6S2A0_9PROT|nr:ABC transporter substrate-binding protein [Roseospira goensis]MBB4287558.1 peptide/nickel transport system substrate-binding protein [Roseospira goensis]
MTKATLLMAGVVAVGLTATAGAVNAEDIVIGAAAEPSAMDPHYHNLSPNNAIRNHIFESLVGQDETQRLYPLLAESWQPLDDTTWEFKLREGVTFHDGTPFTAKDVIYTVCRIPNVPNSPSSFTAYTKAIADMEAPDDHTLIIKTDGPYPLIPTELSTWGIVSAATMGITGDIAFDRDGCTGIDSWPETDDFNNGTLMNGTGPYQFEEFVKGERLVLKKNPDYWGEVEPWDTVTYRPITSAGPRVAALLAGDVDLIEAPPVQDLPRLREDAAVDVVQGMSNRVIYLHMDQHDSETPGITGVDGNPLLDIRVREALSKAINREAIVAKIMDGVAVPAGELLPPGMFGANPLEPDPYDPAAAKALLAEAGYEDGFEVVIGTPNDRYMNDAKVAQAIAQMFTQVGLPTTVDATTKSVFFSRRNNYEFSVYLAGWGAGTGEMSSPLKALVASPIPEKGYGGTNRGRYSDPTFDAMLDEALSTVDEAAREAVLQKASAYAMEQYAILPLHFEVTPWAFRQGLTYTPRADQYTLAMGIRPAE